MRPLRLIGFALTLVLVSCAPQGTGRVAAPGSEQAVQLPTQLNIAVLSQPRTVSSSLNSAGGTGGGPGATTPQLLANAGLTVVNRAGVREPLLAQ